MFEERQSLWLWARVEDEATATEGGRETDNRAVLAATKNLDISRRTVKSKVSLKTGKSWESLVVHYKV